MYPKSCRMPDISQLETLFPGFMSAMVVTEGKMLTPRERLYIRIFVRLVEKAINEYKKARECIIAQVNEAQCDVELVKYPVHVIKLYTFGIIDHLENCINAIRRLFKLLYSVKSERGGLSIDRNLRKRIESHYKEINDIRVAVEHIEGKIQKGVGTKPVMLALTDDDAGVQITKYKLNFEDLARLIGHFHKLALQWLDDYCKIPMNKED
jgi:hypothetical protein